MACGATRPQYSALHSGVSSAGAAHHRHPHPLPTRRSSDLISATFNGEPNGPPTPTCTRGGDGTQPIGCGETKSGRIDSRGETDTFTFTARPDEVVSITAAPVAAHSATRLLPAWSLFGPDGTPVVDSR